MPTRVIDLFAEKQLLPPDARRRSLLHLPKRVSRIIIEFSPFMFNAFEREWFRVLACLWGFLMKHKIADFCWLAFVLASVVAIVGCGSGRPEVSPVRGTVTFGGRPVPTGTIHFWPEEGRPARGTINADGAYTLTTFEPGDGAVLGKHLVTIESVAVSDAAPKPKSVEEEIAIYSDPNTPVVQGGSMQTLIPRAYADRARTPLEARVDRGENTIDFQLKPGM
jgi:hypothetical protein